IARIKSNILASYDKIVLVSAQPVRYSTTLEFEDAHASMHQRDEDCWAGGNKHIAISEPDIPVNQTQDVAPTAGCHHNKHVCANPLIIQANRLMGINYLDTGHIFLFINARPLYRYFAHYLYPTRYALLPSSNR